MRKSKKKLFNKSNYNILVVAHPDDEVIFASSILKFMDLIIICFGEIPNEKKISSGRYSSIMELQKKGYNIEFLKIRQSRELFFGPNWFNLSESINRDKLGLNLYDYVNNNRKIKKFLKPMLKDASVVFTHNPWGEYGHMEHIQVFNIIKNIRSEYNYEIFITGYVSNLTEKYSKEFSSQIQEEKLIRKSDLNIFYKFKKVYLKNNCWTWHQKYKPPSKEYFYKLNEPNFSLEKDKNIELNYINMGNRFLIIIKKIIKNFLPTIFIQKFRYLIP